MKRKNDNLSDNDSATQLDENIARLLKQVGDSNKPSRTFTESLIAGALNELEQLEVNKKNEKPTIIKSHRVEKAMGWAAIVAVGCGTGFTILVSALLKIDFFLQAIVVLTMLFDWLTYFGARIL